MVVLLPVWAFINLFLFLGIKIRVSESHTSFDIVHIVCYYLLSLAYRTLCVERINIKRKQPDIDYRSCLFWSSIHLPVKIKANYFRNHLGDEAHRPTGSVINLFNPQKFAKNE